jgi:VIT1/CCC1 family predicted Fe2+/Mn2+ transporter
MTVMLKPVAPVSRRVLDPIDRVSEILFGLIMVLTFTGSLSVADAGRDDTRTMLIGALGCNVAWGIIDAVLFLMGGVADKGRIALALRAARRSSTSHDAQRMIAGVLPAPLLEIIEPDLPSIEQRLRKSPETPIPGLDRNDWRGGLAVFLLVFLSTLPVAIPFLLFKNVPLAMRLSNLIAIVMLFAMGYIFARVTGRSAWVWSASMVVLGLVLAGLTVALGG